MSSYSVANFSGGIEHESWTATLFINNAFDERAEIDFTDLGYGAGPGQAWTATTNRPRTYGIRFSQRF
jgi:outer membrane receptor protein involved in Fe transport